MIVCKKIVFFVFWSNFLVKIKKEKFDQYFCFRHLNKDKLLETQNTRVHCSNFIPVYQEIQEYIFFCYLPAYRFVWRRVNSFETKFVQIGWKMKLFQPKEGKPAKKRNLRKSSLKFAVSTQLGTHRPLHFVNFCNF